MRSKSTMVRPTTRRLSGRRPRAGAAYRSAVSGCDFIHDDLDVRATERLDRALTARPDATIILAHAGESAPPRIESLLGRHPNLMVDLSGMHFQRKPPLATETGPIDPTWKALIEKMPDRFLFGVDVWAPRLFEPAMLDRLMTWARRVLGELKPDVAEKVAYTNAATLLGVK